MNFLFVPYFLGHIFFVTSHARIMKSRIFLLGQFVCFMLYFYVLYMVDEEIERQKQYQRKSSRLVCKFINYTDQGMVV